MLYFNATLVHYKYNRNWASSISTEECSKSLIRFLKKQKFEKIEVTDMTKNSYFPLFCKPMNFSMYRVDSKTFMSVSGKLTLQ